MAKLCTQCGREPVVSVYGRKCPDCRARTEDRRRERARKHAIRPLVRRAVIERDGAVCRYCGVGLSDEFVARRRFDYNPRRIELDHVVPIRHGGYSVPENLVVSCTGCNRQRGGMASGRLRVIRAFIATEQDAAVLSIYEDFAA